MSWSLSASGHVDPDQQNALAVDLGRVLVKAGDAVSSATFSSNGFNGDPRELASDAKGDDNT